MAYPEYLVTFTRVAPPNLDEWNELKQRASKLAKDAFKLIVESLPEETIMQLDGQVPDADGPGSYNKYLRSLWQEHLLDNCASKVIDGCQRSRATLEAAPTPIAGAQQALEALDKLEHFLEGPKMQDDGAVARFLQAQAEPEPEPEPA